MEVGARALGSSESTREPHSPTHPCGPGFWVGRACHLLLPLLLGSHTICGGGSFSLFSSPWLPAVSIAWWLLPHWDTAGDSVPSESCRQLEGSNTDKHQRRPAWMWRREVPEVPNPSPLQTQAHCHPAWNPPFSQSSVINGLMWWFIWLHKRRGKGVWDSPPRKC